MRRFAPVLAGLLALAGAQLATVTAAHATETGPWQPNTVFAAVSGFRHGGDGGLVAIAPGGGANYRQFGSATDVAVASDGTVYWGNCNGDIYEDTSDTSAASFLFNVGDCVSAVAVQPGGDLLIDTFSALEDCTVGGSCSTVSSGVTGATGLAVDPEGDIYIMSGGESLALLLPDGSYVYTQGVLGGLSLRFDGADLVTATPFHEGVDVWSPESGSAATYSTGVYTDGAAVDSSGDVYASAIVDDPSSQDRVDEFPAGGGGPNDIGDGLDEPGGLATYPAAAAPTRGTSSVELGSDTDPGSPITVNDSVTLTATVDGGSATDGFVQFASNGAPLGDGVPVTGGTAQLTTTLSAGSDDVTATYLGTGSERPSQSTALEYTVNKLATTTRIHSADSRTPPQDQPIHVVASVLPTSSGGGTPTGDVDFYIGSNVVTSASLDSRGRAAADLTLPAHAVRIHAVYSGDSGYDTSTSGSLLFTPTAPYTPTVAASVRYGAFGPNGHENIGIPVTVTGVKGQGAPTGEITTSNGRFTCSALTPATTRQSTAHCFARSLPPDPTDVTITYGGDSVYDQGSTDVFIEPGG